MSEKRSAVNKNCSTCMYWLGERKLVTYDRQVEFDNGSVKGKCSFVKNRTHITQAIGTCKDYEKWHLLKG